MENSSNQTRAQTQIVTIAIAAGQTPSEQAILCSWLNKLEKK